MAWTMTGVVYVGNGVFLFRMSQQTDAANNRPVSLNPRSRYCPTVIYYDAPPWQATGTAPPTPTPPAPTWPVQPGSSGTFPTGTVPPPSRCGPHASVRPHPPRTVPPPPRTSDPNCNICSGGPSGAVNHHHISTEHDRMMALHDRGQAFYYCQVCRARHGTGAPIRRNVIFTSSTMINFWKKDKWNPPFHLDVEAIVGRDCTRQH